MAISKGLNFRPPFVRIESYFFDNGFATDARFRLLLVAESGTAGTGAASTTRSSTLDSEKCKIVGPKAQLVLVLVRDVNFKLR